MQRPSVSESTAGGVGPSLGAQPLLATNPMLQLRGARSNSVRSRRSESTNASVGPLGGPTLPSGRTGSTSADSDTRLLLN